MKNTTLAQILLFMVIFSCREQSQKASVETVVPGRVLGYFTVNVLDAAHLYTEPKPDSKRLLTIPSGGVVTVYANNMSVIDAMRSRAVNLVLVKYQKLTGWLNPDYLIFPRDDNRKLNPFSGKLADFKEGCLAEGSTVDTYRSCSNCGTLNFFPWGGFNGTLGCDTHLNGKWEIIQDSIVVTAEGETMCNHFIGTDPNTDKDFEKKCLEFQKRNHRTYSLKIRRANENWIIMPDLELSAKQDPLIL